MLPRVHAAPDVIDILVSQVRQRVCGDVAAFSRLAVDDDVIVQRRADFAMPLGDLFVLNVQIGAGNGARVMLFGRSDIDEDKALFAQARRFIERGFDFLHGELPRVRGRDIERHRGGDKDGHDAHEMGQAKIACHGAPPW